MQIVNILKIIILFLLITFSWGEQITGYFKTEGWLETDHFGSGFVIVPDRTRPNIWVRVFKFDGAQSDVIGLPNNNSVGRHADWSKINWDDPQNQIMRGGDYYRLIKRIDFSGELGKVPSGSTKCSGGRCYGDWLNNDETWDAEINPYNDKNGRSFLKPSNNINGKMRTRYRFQIYVEDNTLVWYRDKNGNYENTTENPDTYFPLKDVVFRITTKENATSVERDVTAKENHELYIRKSSWPDKSRPDDFKVKSLPPQSRWVNGKLVYNFSQTHEFRSASDYVVSVHAVDVFGNDRVLRFPLSMSPVGAMKLNDSSTEVKTY